MKIALITWVCPTPENKRAASALPYYLSWHREKDIRLDIYTFNANDVSKEDLNKISKELSANIFLLKKPWWIKHIQKTIALFIRMLLKRPFLSYVKLSSKTIQRIRHEKYDGIWVYGEDFISLFNKTQTSKKVLTHPDCVSLYYHRMMSQGFVCKDSRLLMRQLIMYQKYIKIENERQDDVITHHLVGEEDATYLKTINPHLNTIFIRHPHYLIADRNRKICFHTPIRLLVAGQYNLYMKEAADAILDRLAISKGLNDKYAITFLGRGWERHASRLRQVGYNVNMIHFAPNYAEEIIKHDIQLTPISIGTGTKGKVLDAIANGLLVIGTDYAMENIAVRDGAECVAYDSRNISKAIDALYEIPDNIEKYETMAYKGREAILKEHGWSKVSNEFFQLFMGDSICH